MIQDLRFTLFETLSFIGVFQCVYILVYIIFRREQFRYAAIPVLYFCVLAIAFALDAGARFLHVGLEFYHYINMIIWFFALHVSVLVILQMAKGVFTDFRSYAVILLMPIFACGLALYLARSVDECQKISPADCPELYIWLVLCNLVAAGLSMLFLWSRKDNLRNVQTLKFGRERYWLILTLIFNNLAFLLLMFSYFDERLDLENIGQIRTILGLGFVYLVTTSIFRVFPQTIWRQGSVAADTNLSEADLEVIARINKLLSRDKVYQEAGFGRMELARELGIPETQVSYLINAEFNKSLPQLLNEYRLNEAKQLLRETNESVSVIAQETGFSSIATFNRVFKSLEKISPSEYRKNILNIR